MGFLDGLYYGPTSPAPIGLPINKSGWYWMPVGQVSPSTSSSLGVGSLRMYPFLAPVPMSFAAIGAEVTAAGDSGSKFRIGLYGADPATFLPLGVPLVDTTIAGDSNTVQEQAIALSLPAGIYWMGGAVQVVTVTQPTMRTVSGSQSVFGGFSSQPAPGASTFGCSIASVTGALPTLTAGTSILSAGSVCRVFLKVA